MGYDPLEHGMKMANEFREERRAWRRETMSALEGIMNLDKERMQREEAQFKSKYNHLLLDEGKFSCIGCGKKISIIGLCWQCEKQQELMDSLSKRDDEESEKKSEDCSCYITSACLDELGLSRTAPEMQAMKVLTKEHILKSFSGIKDYVRYGKRAPQVVQAIRAKENAKEIWEQVYTSLRKVASSVNSGDLKEGYAKYKDLVLGLENRFVKI